MRQTSFANYVTARRLAGFVDDETLLPAFASSSIEIYPYQIAAARFALRSPYLKGCILCDEGSLGKTYEALLVAAQKWYEGKDRILLVLPPNLIRQWIGKIESGFTLPYCLWDSGDALPDADGLIICTYDFAARHADAIREKPWDLVIFDESDVLAKPQNKNVATLKSAVGSSFKLLLTPTPITMSIMDIYGLIHFIDETVLPDADDFYKRYFRKPENYPELTSWVSRFAFRTLKSQVTEYVSFTKRIPLTLNYNLTTQEKQLYAQLDKYLALPQRAAYPQMEPYDLSLMFFHILSSSPQAFCKTLDGAIARLEGGEEKTRLVEMKTLAKSISVGGKSSVLLTALKQCTATLKRLRIPQKAIVFLDNLTTLDVLAQFLAENGYTIIRSTQPDYMERFHGERSAILLATDTAAKGLDMEFCPVVVNYDLLYNAIEMEQRISRCHRQGQESDVLVINLLSRENFADVRILELVNKRVSQFDGIFGMSDALVGNFDASIGEVLAQIRKTDEIKAAFDENLAAHESGNKRLVTQAEDTLFTTFTKAVADKVAVTPRYIEDKIAALNDQLWQVVTAWFDGREDYTVDERAKTISLTADNPPTLFYYWTGSRNRPYTGQRQYGLERDFRPGGGRIALTSLLAKGIMGEISCADSGEITVDADIEPCQIAFYDVGILSGRTEVAASCVLVGKTASGHLLDNGQCRNILELSAHSCVDTGKVSSYWLRNSTGGSAPHSLDALVPAEELIAKYRQKTDSAVQEEIERIKLRAERQKTALEHSLDDIRARIKAAKQDLEAQSDDRLKELTIGKRLKVLEKQLRGKEQNLFYEQMQINVAAEDGIAALTSKEKYTVRARRQFVVNVSGRV